MLFIAPKNTGIIATVGAVYATPHFFATGWWLLSHKAMKHSGYEHRRRSQASVEFPSPLVYEAHSKHSLWADSFVLSSTGSHALANVHSEGTLEGVVP